MKSQQVFVEDVEVCERMRAFDEARVKPLVESLGAIGLQYPISIWAPDSSTMKLVAGRHRLEAARRLGWEMIDAVVVDLDEIDRNLWEIDENLCRAELSPTEEAEHLARRKELWEAREARAKENTGTGCPTNRSRGQPEGFAANTAKATGKDKRTINRAVRRTHKITSEARDLIRNTKLDTGAYLDKLMKVPEDEQVDRVQRDLAALADKDRREALKREAAEREREAKEAKKHARTAVCDFLLDALSSRQWDQLIGLIEAAGGTLRASDLRDWQTPTQNGEAA